MPAIRVLRRLLRPPLALALAASSLLAVTMAPVQADTGAPPTVTVGADQVVVRTDTAFLPGVVSDDGLPAPSAVTAHWTKVSGPGAVHFSRADEALTTASFDATGDYVLRLTASDGGGQGSAELTVSVVSAPSTTIRVPADYPTIQAALDAAPVHALVLVSPGTYSETITIRRSLTLASTYYTTGDPARIDQTVIQGIDASLEIVAIASGAGADTRFVGFTVTGGKDGVKVRGSGVVEHNRLVGLGTDATEIVSGGAGLIQHNVMQQNGDDGVDLGSSSALVTDNLVQSNNGDGVETRTRNTTTPIYQIIVRGNRFLGNDDNGLQVIDDDTIAGSPTQSATVFTIDHNVIANNTQAGLGLMDNSETTEDYRGASLVERITVTNNTFDGNAYGITGGDNLVAVNNIFARQPNIALKNVDGASRTAFNLFYANGSLETSSNIDAATAISGDPMLDSSFTPQAGSPAIDAGTARYSLPNGEQVVPPTAYQGIAPDLGAIETDGSSTPGDPAVDPHEVVTLTAGGSSSTAGSPVRLAGLVTSNGAAVAHERVTVRVSRAPANHTVTLATTSTGADGRFSLADKPRVTTRYTATTVRGRSATVTVRVRPRLTGQLIRTVVHRGTRTTLQGIVAPADRGQVLRLQRRSGDRWVTMQSSRMPGGGKLGYRFTIRPKVSGRLHMRVLAAAHNGRDAAVTRDLVLRVRR